MKLYFTRHGDAEAVAPSDELRPLSELGHKEVTQVMLGLKSMDISPTHIFASPRRRAQETAQIVANILGGSVTTKDEVNFQFNVNLLRDLIKDLPDSANVFFVGHNPSMSEVTQAVSGAYIAMKTGSIACVSVYGSQVQRGELKWYITPKVYRNLITSS